MHGVLLSLVSPAEAQDLVQEVFLSALRGLGQLEDPGRFGPWLATIARNRGRDALAGAGTGPPRSSSRAPSPRSSRRPPGTDDEQEAARALAAVRSLPEAYREPLILRLVEGLSGPQIADRTGLTHGSVRVNLCRGMKLLRASG